MWLAKFEPVKNSLQLSKWIREMNEMTSTFYKHDFTRLIAMIA